MMLDKYSIDGSVKGQVELNDSVFNSKINDVLIYELIKAANANLRQGNTQCQGAFICTRRRGQTLEAEGDRSGAPGKHSLSTVEGRRYRFRTQAEGLPY